MEKENAQHDPYFRRAMSDLMLTKEFLQSHLPQHLQNEIAWGTLKLCKESFINQCLEEQVVDMLYFANFKQHEGGIYILIEHQSGPEKFMSVRLQKYIWGIIDQHQREKTKKELPIVISMVFYNGQREYPYSLDIFDLFGKRKPFALEFLYKPLLIDLNKIPDEKIREHGAIGLMEFVMKHIREPDFLPYAKIIATQLNSIEQATGLDYILSTINYIIKAGNVSDTEAFFAVINEGLSPAKGEKIMTIRETLIQQGRQSGRQEGREEAAYAIARNLLDSGLSNAAISKATGLPIQEIAQLKISEKVFGN